ncbi:TetR family transcriptional regulator, partial [Escherichia coli]|nr:TetR family transcriptional regulator [Escherichia coli]
QLQQIREAETRIFQVLATHFEREMKIGYLRRSNPLLLAQAFTSLLMLANREDVRSMHENIADLARELVNLFLEGAAQQT